MLAFLPIIGPIIQGIFGIFTKKMDTDVEKLKITRTSDAEEAKVSSEIIKTTQDDLGVRISRDLIIFPVAIWTALLSWDTIVAESILGRDWMWHVASFEKTGAPYLPYAVLTFILGNIGLNMWNRR
jgi:hypothetical protein